MNSLRTNLSSGRTLIPYENSIFYYFGKVNYCLPANLTFDFRDGLQIPEHELDLGFESLPRAVILKQKTKDAQYDILLPVIVDNSDSSLPVRCKCTLDLPSEYEIKRALEGYKKIDENPENLIFWFYLGENQIDKNTFPNVFFIDSRGCCGKQALDLLAFVKELSLRNNLM
jgi:hypothetical protein